MLASVRDFKGLGNGGLYVRLRDENAAYWDFVTQAWVSSEGVPSKVFLTEYPDSDPFESRYQADVTIPVRLTSIVVEYVRSSDGMVRAEETVAGGVGSDIQTQLASVFTQLAKILGLLYYNSVLMAPSYDAAGRLLDAKMRVYDTGDHALQAGSLGLVTEYSVHSEYDANGHLILFRITE